MSTTKRNWKVYNSLKTRRFQIFLAMLLLIVDAVPVPSPEKRGRPPTDYRVILICGAIKVYLKVSYRELVGCLEMLKEDLGLEKVPHFNTIRKYMVSSMMATTLGAALLLTVQPIAALETVFASDGTGFSTSNRSEYYTIRLKGRKIKIKSGKKVKLKDALMEKKKKKGFVKLHIAIGAFTLMIAAATATLGNRHDSTQLGALVEQVTTVFSIEDWCADSAYLSRDICNLVAKNGGMPYIWPKSNTTARSKGSHAWRKMVLLFQENLDEFKRHYHQRSKVESVFMVLKRHFGDYVLSRKEEAQLNELLFKAVDYNLYRLGEVALTMGLDIGLEMQL